MRIGHSWPSGRGTRTWISMPFWGWVLAWLLASPFVAAWIVLWLAVRLIVAAVRGVIWLVRRVHDAPAVPRPLRTPPKRP